MNNSIQLDVINQSPQNISDIKQSVAKLQYVLEYDRNEIDRLRADLGHILDVDISKYRCSFLGKLLLKYVSKNNKKLTNLNIELLNSCTNSEYNECIESLNLYINRLIKSQQNIANTRYDIRNYILNPSSSMTKSLIIMLFNLLELEYKFVDTNLDNINIYLLSSQLYNH